MKRIALLLATLMATCCFVAMAQNTGKATMKFADTMHDFGRVDEQGGPVAHEFVFTNTGSKPLVINEINTNCDCTTARFPQEPVMPGKQGKVVITYDPEGNPGEFAKEIVIKSNAAKRKTRIYIRGMVFPKQ